MKKMDIVAKYFLDSIVMKKDPAKPHRHTLSLSLSLSFSAKIQTNENLSLKDGVKNLLRLILVYTICNI